MKSMEYYILCFSTYIVHCDNSRNSLGISDYRKIKNESSKIDLIIFSIFVQFVVPIIRLHYLKGNYYLGKYFLPGNYITT